MNNKIVIILLLLTLVILTGIPASLALPQYNTSLNKVYGTGSCSTCHVNASNDGPRTPYGKLFENQTNHSANTDAALKAIGAPPSITPTLTPTITLTPAATRTMTPTMTITPTTTITPTMTIEATPEVTTVKATEKQTTPGFGIVLSLIGLFAWALLAKRNN